jgi:hypothetical protein
LRRSKQRSPRRRASPRSSSGSYLADSSCRMGRRLTITTSATLHLVLRLRGGGLVRRAVEGLLGRGLFCVNESFVISNLGGSIGREETELMKAFIEQSLPRGADGEDRGSVVAAATTGGTEGRCML